MRFETTLWGNEMTDMENAEATPRIGRVRRTVLAVAGITAMAGTVMVLTSLGSGASAAPADPKVTLCHRTDSETNPYVQITIAAAAAFNAHFKLHQGDVWFPGHPKEPKWGDIIPPSTFNGNDFQENWDAAGQAIFNNGCQPVVVTTTTPVPPPSTSTVPESNPPSSVTTSSSVSISASSSASVPPATSTTAATSVGPIPSGVSAGLHSPVSGAGIKAWGTILMLLGGAAGLLAGLWPTRRRAH
jgi:hypothetical protein